MLVKYFTLTGTHNEFTITVPTIYKFMTVFNHSRHRLQFFADTNIDLRQMLYRVPSQIYLTLPLTLSGEVETCQRLTTYTMVSEGENIAPTNISIMFSEQMENINLPFPDPVEQPININNTTTNIEHFIVSMPLADTQYSLVLPPNTKKIFGSIRQGDNSFHWRLSYITGRVAVPTEPILRIEGTQNYFIENINIPAGTIFIACSAIFKVAQFEIWT